MIKPAKDKIRNILVIRPDAIGDLVLTLPAIQALKGHFPEAKITALIREYTRPVADASPAIDEVIYDYDLKKYNFDLSVNFYNEFKDTFAAFKAGIPFRLGDSSRILTAWMNNLRVFRDWTNRNLHEVEQNMELLKPLEITAPAGKPIIIPGPLPLAVKEGKRLAGLHCGSATSRPWPSKDFANAAKLILENNYQLFLLGSEKENASAEMIKGLNPAAINLAGKLSLENLISLISKLNFYLGMDTGPSHIAAAFNVPMVMLFLNPQARPYRWGPWLARHLTVTPEKSQKEIDSAAVIAAIKAVLGGGGVAGLEESRVHWLAAS